MAQQVEIIRKATFVVQSSEVDTYGNLMVTDKGGETHKIGEKRPHLFDTFQPDIAVEVGYANTSFKDKEGNTIEYIATAVKVEGALSPPVKTTTAPVPEHEDVPAPPKPIAPQAIGMMTKEIGDMMRAGLLTKIFGVEAAANLVTWYRGEATGITRIAFDGAKYPKLDKETK